MKSDEQYDHFSFFFWIRILVILGKKPLKTQFFGGFYFDPTHFSAENRQTTKKFRPTTQHT